VSLLKKKTFYFIIGRPKYGSECDHTVRKDLTLVMEEDMRLMQFPPIQATQAENK